MVEFDRILQRQEAVRVTTSAGVGPDDDSFVVIARSTLLDVTISMT